MINFLLGVSVTLNLIFAIISFLVYKNYEMKNFLEKNIKKDDIWDW